MGVLLLLHGHRDGRVGSHRRGHLRRRDSDDRDQTSRLAQKIKFWETNLFKGGLKHPKSTQMLPVQKPGTVAASKYRTVGNTVPTTEVKLTMHQHSGPIILKDSRAEFAQVITHATAYSAAGAAQTPVNAERLQRPQLLPQYDNRIRRSLRPFSSTVPTARRRTAPTSPTTTPRRACARPTRPSGECSTTTSRASTTRVRP